MSDWQDIAEKAVELVVLLENEWGGWDEQGYCLSSPTCQSDLMVYSTPV